MNALKGAFDAKIGKVPVIAIGIPAVIIGGLVLRKFGNKSADAADTSTDTSQPDFFAKSVPDTWAAIDPSTGVGHSPDGTIAYIPTTGNDPVDGGTGSATGGTPGDGTSDPATPVTPPTPAPKPVPKPPAKKPPVVPKPSPPAVLTPNHALTATHKIKSGETLTSIAKANHTTVSNLQKLNPGIKNPNLIYAGSNLKVPVAKKK
jgi:LysM repeat protein